MYQNTILSIYVVSIVLLVISILGIYEMRISGSLIEDMPKKKGLLKAFSSKRIWRRYASVDWLDAKGGHEIVYAETEWKLEETIDEIPGIVKPISIVNLVKYSKQAYYKQADYTIYIHPGTMFILSFAKNATKNSKKRWWKAT
jgi:hypothetical protein